MPSILVCPPLPSPRGSIIFLTGSCFSSLAFLASSIFLLSCLTLTPSASFGSLPSLTGASIFCFFTRFSPLSLISAKTKLIWLARLRIGDALPKARGFQRCKVVPSSTLISVIFKLSRSISKLCLALATAELINLTIGFTANFLTNFNWSKASSTVFPRATSTTRRTFLGDILICFALAFISIYR